ncbi:hypothetical protein GGH91_003299 [Coemansia sp. RSA 2671]|uniref:Uncharacterized protein n=1 Tax=Coemansia linderi TaxID=2663919 RepID=A0ACC1KK02_9FUNG|nr:hypothetical protein LPJ60_003238 [Coemansia sp. RSA 2675]KAJ2343109.1 hypothetical protein GGH91_003299 [Coemansia sp. RSA 2671]KAJ2790859.1 hypothetical protein GGI18_001535 [Coemansia linderi]
MPLDSLLRSTYSLMSRALGIGLGWLRGGRLSIPVCCLGAMAGYTIYCLVADQWISSRRCQTVKKRQRLRERAAAAGKHGSIADADIDVSADKDAAIAQYASLEIGGRFVNPFAGWRDKTLLDFVWWLATRKSGNGLTSDDMELERNLPLATPHFGLLDSMSGNQHPRRARQEQGSVTDCEYAEYPAIADLNKDSTITVTWFGQSTCFVQLEGLNILTDPIFKQRTVFSWLGPERLRPTPCQLADLPHPDIVLVSHNHFDHLDVDVVRDLGNTVTWYVPLGLRDWFVRRGVYKVVEMDWWQECEHVVEGRSFKVVSTPTQHWSGRNGFDSNCSLWSSFLVKGANSSVFHCGDTGYCPAFSEVGRKYGSVSLAILPIGSYEPRWYMCHQHINPEDAVLIHRDLGARNSIGVHWGTFMMSDEHYMAPPRDLLQACIKHGLKDLEFIAPKLGKTLIYQAD